MEIAMDPAGPQWLGYFPMKGERTSGKPDSKEGIWFGNEVADPSDPRLVAGYPVHGINKYPRWPSEVRSTVEEYMRACARAGRAIMEGIALSLGLEEGYFEKTYTADPCIQLGIMHYPPIEDAAEWEGSWGVGEHTDYGLLTLLHQDNVGGLQVNKN
jgi:isopenicillin N synthase-like dioxygenase